MASWLGSPARTWDAPRTLAPMARHSHAAGAARAAGSAGQRLACSIAAYQTSAAVAGPPVESASTGMGTFIAGATRPLVPLVPVVPFAWPFTWPLGWLPVPPAAWLWRVWLAGDDADCSTAVDTHRM